MVLIIDDDSFQSFILKEHLKRFAEVTIAHDGSDGYTKLLNMKKNGDLHTLRFVITDLQMPNVDGFGFTRLMKTNIDTKHIPVFGHTSSTLDDVINHAKSVGMERVFSKTNSLNLITHLKSLSLL